MQVRAWNMLASRDAEYTVIIFESVINNDPMLILKLSKNNMTSNLCSSQAQLLIRSNIHGFRPLAMRLIDVNYPINDAAQKVITNYDIHGRNYNEAMHIADQVNNMSSVVARIDKQETFASLLYDAGYSDIASALKLQGCTIK